MEEEKVKLPDVRFEWQKCLRQHMFTVVSVPLFGRSRVTGMKSHCLKLGDKIYAMDRVHMQNLYSTDPQSEIMEDWFTLTDDNLVNNCERGEYLKQRDGEDDAPVTGEA